MTDELTDKERRMLDTWTAIEPPADFADRVIGANPGRRWLPYAVAAVSVAAAATVLVIVLPSETVTEPAPIAIALPDAGFIGQTPDSGAAVEPRITDAAIPLVDAMTITPGGPYDVDLGVGTTATIHDPLGETRVNFHSTRCKAGMQIELARDSRFSPRTANQGVPGVVMSVGTGAWHYRASCMAGGMPEAPFATGQLAVARDDARRRIMMEFPYTTVEADGRTYKISYQANVPVVIARRPTGGETLHLVSPNGSQKLDARGTNGDITVGAGPLVDGTHSFWFTRGGVTVGKVSTLVIAFDESAPQVMLEAPADGDPATSRVEVRGSVVAGWNVAFEATKIPVDAKQRFTARVRLRDGFKSIALRLEHPQRGTHFYVRRLR